MYRTRVIIFATAVLLALAGCSSILTTHSLPVQKGALKAGEVLVFSHSSLLGGLPGIYMADSKRVTRLAGEPKKYCTDPLWSPGGSQFIYTQSYGWETDLFLLDVQSRDSHQLTSDNVYKYSPRWSPDGKYLAYRSTTDPEHPALHPVLLNIMALTNGESQRFEFERVLDYQWRPEGNSIFALASTNGEIQAYEVYPDGTWEALEGNVKFLEDANAISLSPDASHAAYSVFDPAPDALADPLYVAAIDGSGERKVGSFSVDSSIAWSPDGGSLAFVSLDEEHRYALFVVNTDGSELKELLILDPGDDSGEILPGTPAWSPDSQKIAIASFINLKGAAIFILNKDGSEIRQVTDPDGLIFGISWKP